MNWLAHIFLSEHTIDFQIGNYLADPLKGKTWENAPYKLQQGMHVHKIIDTFTDAHPCFKQSKNRLGSKGLLKGVVIDLTYDYLLTKNWHSFCVLTLQDFLNAFYKNAYSRLPHLPLKAKNHLKSMVDFDLLNQYKTLTQLNEAFVRVDKRLSPRLKQRDQATLYHDRICQHIHLIEEDFMHFFPQLCHKVKQHVETNNLKHWKI